MMLCKAESASRASRLWVRDLGSWVVMPRASRSAGGSLAASSVLFLLIYFDLGLGAL